MFKSIRERLAPDLIAWFSDDIDEGDAPELHLVNLQAGELERCFATLEELGAKWTDRQFYLDAEDVDVTVAQRPDVAALVAAGRAKYACLGATDITVEGVTLPLVEMFLFIDEIEFFWWPDADWTSECVAAFLCLLERLHTLAPSSKLRPDPRYPLEHRRAIGARLAHALDAPERIALS